MKRLLTSFIFLLAAIAGFAYNDGEVFTAKTVEGIDMTFKVISATEKTCQVGRWKGSCIDTSTEGTITIPATIEGFTVTSIGDDAFQGCSGLTSVMIPNSVTNIGNYTFTYCSGLTSVMIPNSVTSIGSGAFSGCSGLTSVTIGNSVTNIGGDAFWNCSGLTSVMIPNSVTSIGSGAFSGCSGLTSVTIPNSVTGIGGWAFKNCSGLTSITIGNSVTSIGSSAFSGCSGLISITIPNSVTSIGNDAFAGCIGLTSVTIGNSVTRIGNYAFSDCSALTSVHISDLEAWCHISFDAYYSNPLNYAHHLFLNNVEIMDLVIPNSVTSIGSYAFSRCSGLISVTIPNSVTSIGDDSFYHCSGLTSITIGNSVTIIGENAFSGCSGLTSVYISDLEAWCNISYRYTYSNPLCYAHHLFLNGTEIKDLVIPNSVTSIGGCAFYNCSGLTSVTIPNSVTSIGGFAFCCENLKDVHSEIMDPFDIDTNTFHETTYSGTLYVPKGTAEKYKQKEGWKNFVKIEERKFQLFLSATPPGGEVERGTKVVLSVKDDLGNDMNDATIFYTIDGSEPTTNSIRYKDGVTIDHDITLRAIAEKEGYQQGELAATTYTIPKIFANSITLDITSKTVNVDEHFTLTATITPDDADDKTLTWSSSNKQVAIVKGNDGMTAEVTATGVGTATITAMTANGKKAKCHVTVHGQKLVLKTSVGSGEVLQGDKLVLTMMDEDRNEVTDATIYYTTDGSAPTEQSTIYTSPIIFEKSFTLRAIARGQRYEDSDELQETYTVIEDDTNERWVDEEQGLTYAFNTSDTSAKLMLVDKKTEGDVKIRSSFEKYNKTYTVTQIRKNILDHADGVTSVTVPSSVTDIGVGAFSNESLLALIWQPDMAVAVDILPEESMRNKNFLLYVDNEAQAPDKITNVLVKQSDGNYRAKGPLALVDDADFHCPLAFTADVSYTHNYTMETGLGSSQGWESLALPFNVQTITHENGQTLKPFAGSSSNERPFWLYELTERGFEKASAIKANTPYIISMPNNEAYLDDYNVVGKVTFAAKGATVKASTTVTTVGAGSKGVFRPTFRTLRSSTETACLNSVNDLHKATGGETEGSRFITNLRKANPFEAVFEQVPAGTRSFGIDIVSGIEDCQTDSEESTHRIYDLRGLLVRSCQGVTIQEAIKNLPAGIYIVGGRKVVVQ